MKRPGTLTSVKDAEGSRLRRGDKVRLSTGNTWFRHYIREVIGAAHGLVLFEIRDMVMPIPRRFVHKVH